MEVDRDYLGRPASSVPTVCVHPVRLKPGRITSPCCRCRRWEKVVGKRRLFHRPTTPTIQLAHPCSITGQAIPDRNSTLNSILKVTSHINTKPCQEETWETEWDVPFTRKESCGKEATRCLSSNNSKALRRLIILLRLPFTGTLRWWWKPYRCNHNRAIHFIRKAECPCTHNTACIRPKECTNKDRVEDQDLTAPCIPVSQVRLQVIRWTSTLLTAEWHPICKFRLAITIRLAHRTTLDRVKNTDHLFRHLTNTAANLMDKSSTVNRDRNSPTPSQWNRLIWHFRHSTLRPTQHRQRRLSLILHFRAALRLLNHHQTTIVRPVSSFSTWLWTTASSSSSNLRQLILNSRPDTSSNSLSPIHRDHHRVPYRRKSARSRDRHPAMRSTTTAGQIKIRTL